MRERKRKEKAATQQCVMKYFPCHAMGENLLFMCKEYGRMKAFQRFYFTDKTLNLLRFESEKNTMQI